MFELPVVPRNIGGGDSRMCQVMEITSALVVHGNRQDIKRYARQMLPSQMLPASFNSESTFLQPSLAFPTFHVLFNRWNEKDLYHHVHPRSTYLCSRAVSNPLGRPSFSVKGKRDERAGDHQATSS